MPFNRLGTAESLLVARGAENVDHPGGNLLDHLRRVRNQLAAWDASAEVQLAGLCHTAYGTDGFAVTLLNLYERPILAEAIGAEAEQLVYLHSSCDRSKVYPQLGHASVEFADRFTGRCSRPEEHALQAFAEITAANELDVVCHSSAIASEHGPALRQLFERAGRRLSARRRPPARRAGQWSRSPVPNSVFRSGGSGEDHQRLAVDVGRLKVSVLSVAVIVGMLSGR